MVRTKISAEDVSSLLFEIGQIFTPSTPIKLAELFAGRGEQINQMIESVAEPGRHLVLYGERGVGKTSISQILEYIVPAGRQKVAYYRKACSPGDTFETIWRKFFKEIHFYFNNELHSSDELYPGAITPDDVVREMKNFSSTDVPLFVIDEFNEITDVNTSNLLANTIKSLSDEGTNATIVTVGVADNVTDLFGQHQSISRCTEQILMPRMSNNELLEIIDKRLGQLGLSIDGNARWKMVVLSRGLPTYVHRLGKIAASKSVRELRVKITEADVDAAIDEMLQGSLKNLKDKYDEATLSNQPGNLFQEVLLACALAKADDSGYFVPASVREPLSMIVRKPMQIAQYQQHLGAFASDKRGNILQRDGEERAYRFRFKDPAMQPFVLMKGIASGMAHDSAKAILRHPEQGDLFPSG
jgi:Cdc6-like AAA superfamily ATPase